MPIFMCATAAPDVFYVKNLPENVISVFPYLLGRDIKGNRPQVDLYEIIHARNDEKQACNNEDKTTVIIRWKRI